MKHDEKLMTELLQTSKKDDIPLIDTVTNYCDEHDIEPAELVKFFDEQFLKLLKESAVQDNVYLKKFIKKRHRRSLF